MRVQEKPISDKAQYWFKFAKEVAEKSDHRCFHHGAVLVKGGSIIEKSANYDRYLSFADQFRKYGEWHGTYHAEIGCLYGRSKENIGGSSLFVVRINPCGLLRNSEPCKMCLRALEYMDINEVVYSINEETVGEIKL